MKAPSLIQKAGLGKRGAVILEFMNFCTWIPLALAFLFGHKGIAPLFIAFLWFVNIMPGMLLSIQRDNWLSNLVPKEALGRYLGQRLAIKSAFYLGTFCFLGFLLDEFEGNNLLGFGFVLTIGVLATFIDFIIFTYMYDPQENEAKAPKNNPEEEKFKLFEFFRELKEKKLSSFVYFSSLFYITVGLSGPLYAVYMLQELKFTYLSFTLIIAIEYLARIVSSPFWGRMADKDGNIKVLGIVGRIIPFLPILWLFSSNIIYLAVVQSISGVCWGAYDLCNQSYLYKVAPPQRKLRYIVYTRSLMMLSTAVGGLLGAYAVQVIFPIFGSKLLSVFLLSGVFRAAVVLQMMPKLVDLAVTLGRPFRQFNGDISIGRAATSKRGMYYHRQNFTASPGLVPIGVHEPVIMSEKTPSNRRKWIDEKKERPVKRENEHRPVTTTTRMGLFQQPDVISVAAETMTKVPVRPTKPNRVPESKSINARTSVKKTSESGLSPKPAVNQKTKQMNPGMKTTATKRGTSRGLYYNSEGWSKYMRQSMKAIMMESQDPKAIKKVKFNIVG